MERCKDLQEKEMDPKTAILKHWDEFYITPVWEWVGGKDTEN